MAKGQHPPTEFTSDNAREMQLRGAAKKRSNAERVKLIDDNLDEILSDLNADRPLKDYARLAVDGRNQFQRIYHANLADHRKALAALQDIIDRVKGRPAKTINLGNTEGGKFGITVRTKEDADFIGGVLDKFNEPTE